jgi:hypothetical protein
MSSEAVPQLSNCICESTCCRFDTADGTHGSSQQTMGIVPKENSDFPT